MTFTWEAELLREVPADLPDLVDTVVTSLLEPGEFVTQMVTQFFIALDASLAHDAPALLADQLRWQRTRLAVVAPDVDRTEVLAAVRAALAGQLGTDALAAVERHVGVALDLAERELADDEPEELSEQAARYLDLLLRGDRRGAVALVSEAVDAGLDPAVVLLEILQPVQVEIGRLWEAGRASVAHEHFGTSVTQQCIAMLYPHLTRGRVPLGRTLVAVSAGVEAHEVGLRIVVDLLERAGWHTSYLGPGIPADEVVAHLVDQSADVLAVSATMSGQVSAVARLVAAVRADPRCSSVRVLVGGRPFLLAPELATQIGADAFAEDGPHAVEVCERLVAQTAPVRTR